MIYITVTFDQAVSVTGTPFLMLETGDTARPAVYASGTGTNELCFVYTVQPGDLAQDLDYKAASAFILNGAAIVTEGRAVQADLTLPVPGSAESLSGNKNIRIDAVSPSAILISGKNLLAVIRHPDPYRSGRTFDSRVLVRDSVPD
jgi:hypothetical protein